jgi:hypothetical protein
VTMTTNNKAVKGCDGLPPLFTLLPRRRGLLGNRASRNQVFLGLTTKAAAGIATRLLPP